MNRWVSLDSIQPLISGSYCMLGLHAQSELRSVVADWTHMER